MIAQIVVAVISFGAGAASSAGGATATAANVADDAANVGAKAGAAALNSADDAAIAGAEDFEIDRHSIAFTVDFAGFDDLRSALELQLSLQRYGTSTARLNGGS